jgi:4-amino-4-deoxy-L-arabinose transferase-like glycosyltransferase
MRMSAGKQLALLLIVAFGVRLAAGCVWQSRLDDGQFEFGDSQSYWDLGRSIARAEPYQYGEAKVFRTPGYPLLLAPVFLVGGEEASVMWARAESAFFGMLSVAGVWWLGRELFDARTGLAAAGIAAVYPGSVAIGALVLSEAPFCPLMLLNLILWIAAWNAGSTRRMVLLAVSAGLVAGAATLVRPSWLLFLFFATGVGLATRTAKGRHLTIGAAMLAGLVVAMLPWWVRNTIHTGHFIPTTLQVGASLYDGWSPDATGASNMDWVDREAARFVESERTLPANGRDKPGDTLEYRLDRHLHAESLSWARSNPGRVLGLMGIKLARNWNFWPNEAAFSAWPIRLVVLVTYLPVMILAAMGARKTIQRGWPYVLCWLPAVYFTMLHVVFVSSIRYRQPAMLTLIVLAAGAIVARSGGHDKSSP